MRRAITVVGARPQFVKAAPVSRVFAQQPDIKEVMVHTGQHYDFEMSQVFFEELGLPAPAYQLALGGGGHGEMTGRMLEALEKVMLEVRPDAVLVYGDTNSTLAGALAAAKLSVPVAHVEAGLRSFRRSMPEEINRVMADHLSSVLLCPTQVAVENLAREGVTSGVHHVGDVMYDAALLAREVAGKRSDIVEKLALEQGAFALMTLHRAENVDEPGRLSRMLDYVMGHSDGPVVFPVHPRTRKAVDRAGLALHGFVVTEPLGYLDLTRLLCAARTVYTDSGGLQKEAYFHRVECVTLRDETEWTETLSNGWNRLWSQDGYADRHDIEDYGDGHSAQLVVEHVLRLANTGPVV